MPTFQRTIKAIQHADDGPGALGVGEDAEALTWNNATGHFTTSAGGGGGGGNVAYTDAQNTFWFAVDGGGAQIVWSGHTDALGVARDAYGALPRLDPGTYYVFRSRPGYVFRNPDTEVVNE